MHCIHPIGADVSSVRELSVESAFYTSVMFAKYTVAELGALIADPSRVEMLTLLLDGGRHSAGELARAAGLSPQAASAHLTRLTAGGLARVTRSGRRRLFELDRPEVGHMLEALGAATRRRMPTRDADTSTEPIRVARTCYDHLAGRVAVLLTRAWVERGVLSVRGGEFDLTSSGDRWFHALGIDTSPMRDLRRAFVRGCLDWTEREPHVGGAVGAAWLRHCLAEGWVRRMPSTRAVRVSEPGRKAFRQLLGFDLPIPRHQR
jgi:DNA-binding transcriptional ArsR family regulator